MDDIASAAADFADLIARATGLSVVARTDAEGAMAVVRENSVKVVVLDEQMPVPGTELFAQIRSHNPNIRALMLTSQATDAAIGQALNDGYSAYLKKQDVELLPERVLEQYVRAVTQSALAVSRTRQTARQQVSVKGPRRLGRRRAKFVIEVMDSLTVAHHTTLDEAWHIVERVRAGETIVTTSEDVATEEVVIEHGSSERLVGALSSSAIIGSASIKAEIGRTLLERETRHVTKRNATQRTLQLPAETQDRDRPQLRSRTREQAPSYWRVAVTLRIQCVTCEEVVYRTVTAYVHDGGYLTREVDYYSDGEQRVLETERLT